MARAPYTSFVLSSLPECFITEQSMEKAVLFVKYSPNWDDEDEEEDDDDDDKDGNNSNTYFTSDSFADFFS